MQPALRTPYAPAVKPQHSIHVRRQLENPSLAFEAANAASWQLATENT